MSTDIEWPTLERNGYQIDAINEDGADYPHPLPKLPSNLERYAVLPGALVKLIFRYKIPAEVNGLYFDTERMWVEVLENNGSHFVGVLDSKPRYTQLFSKGAIIQFHAWHIIAIGGR